jgi:tRNA A-37 threonylcarbamoyl transferase component Bud32
LKEILNNNNNYYNGEVRQSSQPKIEINKIYGIRRNKIINIDGSLSKSNVSEISDNNNLKICNTDNKNKSRYNKAKENYYKKERKKDNNSFMNSNRKPNKSFIVKDNTNLQTKKENNINNTNNKNNNKAINKSMRNFDYSIEVRKSLNNKMNTPLKFEDEDDELKEFNFDEYKIITQLGQGTFGKIYLVQDQSKKLFSMKKIVLSEELDVQSVIKEYRMCYKIKHPNVIKILGIYNNKLDKTTYVVYVLMEVGLTDWEKEIKSYGDKHLSYTEDDLINIIKQLTSILAFLQRKNISHRDIKPQNILVFKNKIYKIADFGEAKQIENISKSIVVNSLRGTELYMSPLLFNGLRTGQVDIRHNVFKSDVYSFGLCILFAGSLEMMSLYDIRKYVDMSDAKKYLDKMFKNKYSQKFIDLLSMLLEIHENKRPDFIDLEKIIQNW